MHIVVNHFTLQESVDWSALEEKVDQFQAHMASGRSDFRGVSLARERRTHYFRPAFFPSMVFFQLLSGLNSIMRRARDAVSGPRSFW